MTRDRLVIVALTILSTWLLVDGYRSTGWLALAQMGVGAAIASYVYLLVVRVTEPGAGSRNPWLRSSHSQDPSR